MNTERLKLMFAVITKIWTNNVSIQSISNESGYAIDFFYRSKCSEDIAKMILIDNSFCNRTLSGSSFAYAAISTDTRHYILNYKMTTWCYLFMHVLFKTNNGPLDKPANFSSKLLSFSSYDRIIMYYKLMNIIYT